MAVQVDRAFKVLRRKLLRTAVLGNRAHLLPVPSVRQCNASDSTQILCKTSRYCRRRRQHAQTPVAAAHCFAVHVHTVCQWHCGTSCHGHLDCQCCYACARTPSPQCGAPPSYGQGAVSVHCLTLRTLAAAAHPVDWACEGLPSFAIPAKKSLFVISPSWSASRRAFDAAAAAAEVMLEAALVDVDTARAPASSQWRSLSSPRTHRLPHHNCSPRPPARPLRGAALGGAGQQLPACDNEGSLLVRGSDLYAIPWGLSAADAQATDWFVMPVPALIPLDHATVRECARPR